MKEKQDSGREGGERGRGWEGKERERIGRVEGEEREGEDRLILSKLCSNYSFTHRWGSPQGPNLPPI